MPFIKSANEAIELTNKIDLYISEHESKQLEKLNELAAISKTVYGFDKTMEKYSENIELFQSFFSHKSQLSALVEQIAIDNEAKRDEEKRERERQQREEEFERIRQRQREEEELLRQQQIEIAEFEYQEAVSSHESPRFTRELGDATITEGDRHTFECQVIGNPPPRVEWFKDGIPIKNCPDYAIRNLDGVCSLIIEETFTEDSARFSCTATNSLGSAETSGRLFVKEVEPENIPTPAHFIRPLQNSTVTEGASLLLECMAAGNPLPTVQWFKNDDCIDNSPKYAITYNNGDARLRLDQIVCDDQAIYTCKARNALGGDQCSASVGVIAAVQPLPTVQQPFDGTFFQWIFEKSVDELTHFRLSQFHFEWNYFYRNCLLSCQSTEAATNE